MRSLASASRAALPKQSVPLLRLMRFPTTGWRGFAVAEARLRVGGAMRLARYPAACGSFFRVRSDERPIPTHAGVRAD